MAGGLFLWRGRLPAAMPLMIGPSVCTACGYVGMVVTPLEGINGSTDNCDECGGEGTEHVRVWFLASLWPDCVELVQFNRERNRLRLPTLTEAVWH